MKKHIITACLYTAITAILLGVVYPLGITILAKAFFPKQASGQLIVDNGQVIGSRLIGQPFDSPTYFHGRPSAAGVGYDATASSGTNLGPTSQLLVDRIHTSVQQESSGIPVPIDLVTASASGLDPDISPAAALYQVARVARERHLSRTVLQQLVIQHIQPRQFGLLGEPTVNVLALNLALDQIK